MRSSTGSPSTKRTDATPPEAGPGAAGAAPGPASARADVPPHLKLPRRLWLLPPACGVLVALCAVLAGWHAPAPAEPAGFDLRAGPASSNVDSNSAGPAGADPAPPPGPPLDTPRGGQEDSEDKPHVIIGPVPPRQSAPPPLAPAPKAPAIELPPLPEAPPPPGPSDPNAPPLTLAPLLPPAEPSELHRDLQRGDSTMSALKNLGLPVALAAFLSAQPLATAGDVEKPPTPEQTARDLKDLKQAQEKSFKELGDQLKLLNERLKSLDDVRKDIDGLKDSVQNINRELTLSAQAHNRTGQDLEQLRAQLKQARDDLEKARAQAGKMQDQIMAHSATCDALNAQISQLKKQLADGSRQAARITEGAGTIRLYNTSPLPADVVVNSRAHHLEPGESVTLANQPVGPFSYEVLGLAPRENVTLTADRPFEIEVFDRARGPIKTPPRPPR